MPAVLPRPANLTKPKIISAGPIARNGAVLAGPGMNPYVGKSEGLSRALFDDMEAGQLASQIYEVEDGFVVVYLVSRADPDMQKFAAEKDSLAQSIAREKSQRTVDEWAAQRCRTVAGRGDIRVNTAYVSYGDSETGQALPSTYKVCQSSLTGS